MDSIETQAGPPGSKSGDALAQPAGAGSAAARARVLERCRRALFADGEDIHDMSPQEVEQALRAYLADPPEVLARMAADLPAALAGRADTAARQPGKAWRAALRARVGRHGAWLLGSSLAAGAAAAALVVLLWPAPPADAPRPGPVGGVLQPKSAAGSADRLTLAVLRGDERFVVQPGDTLRDEDRVGLFFSAGRAGYLAVVHLDQQHVATVLHPDQSRTDSAAPIELATDAVLPDSAVMTPGQGCEWFVGVFSDVPLPLSYVQQQVRGGFGLSGDCRLALAVPGARTVRAIPVQRGDEP